MHHKSELQESFKIALELWRSRSLDQRPSLVAISKKALEITSRRRAFAGRNNCLAFGTNWAIASQHSGVSAGVSVFLNIGCRFLRVASAD